MTTLCEKCQRRPAEPLEELCQQCLDNAAEAAWEREQSDGFRGDEAGAFVASEQARVQREAK